jgi:hypothetical protein
VVRFGPTEFRPLARVLVPKIGFANFSITNSPIAGKLHAIAGVAFLFREVSHASA